MTALKIGQKAPGISLPDQDGTPVSLADYAGRKVLLYFYPQASTPGCTTQACVVRDALADLSCRGVAAIGISPDPPARQKVFDDTYRLGFPLLCDLDRGVATSYGVWGEKSRDGRTYMGIIRSAFLVDEQGVIAQVWYKVNPDQTVANVLASL